jgi:hypothetical protein
MTNYYNSDGYPMKVNLEVTFMDTPNINYNPVPYEYKQYIPQIYKQYTVNFAVDRNERVIFYDTDNNHYFEFNEFEFDYRKLKEADTDIMCDIAEYVLVNGG